MSDTRHRRLPRGRERAKRPAAGRLCRIGLCLVAVAVAGSAHGMEGDRLPRPRFEWLSGNELLPDLRVMDLTRDRDGFLWIGTFGGLVRYDGHAFRLLDVDPRDPTTLSDGRIHSLLLGRDGTLWAATWEAGLNRVDTRTGRATRFRHDPEDPTSLSDDKVQALFQDRQGRLWVGTAAGLNRLDAPESGFVRYVHDPDDATSLAEDDVTAVVEDADGRLWFGMAAGGLDRLDPEETGFTHHRHDPGEPASLGDDRIRALATGPAGRLWIASWGGGLDVLDIETGRFTHHRHAPADPHTIPGDNLLNVWLDRDGQVWVISLTGGLARVDPITGIAQRFPHEPGRVGSPSEALSGAIHLDEAGSLWLGTYGRGVEVWHPSKPAVDHYRAVGGRPDTLANDWVPVAIQSSDGDVWAGTRGGLSRFDPQEGRFTTFRHDPADPGSLGADFIYALLEDGAGELWVGTWGAGLNRLDRTTGGFVKYPCGADAAGGLADCDVRVIFEDGAGDLWVGTYQGLYRLDRTLHRFERFGVYPTDPSGLSDPIVSALAEGPDGALWIGTKHGLNRLRRGEHRFERFTYDPGDTEGLAHPEVASIVPARDGSLWLGTPAGLQRLSWDEAGAPHIESISADGLPPRLDIEEILEDDDGRLWIATGGSGLWRFDPGTGEARQLGPAEGLPRGGAEGAPVLMRDGRLLIGSFEGLALLDPATLDAPPRPPPPVVITSLAVSGHALVAPGEPLRVPDELTLPYPDRTVTIEFASLDLQTPGRNRFRYRLEGAEEEWVTLPSGERRVSYSNLHPGDYAFHVTASSTDGTWDDRGASLRLTVAPAWWETLAFRLAVLAGLVGAALLLHRWRLHTIQHANRLLEGEILERRTAEAQLRRLSGRLVTAQDEERRRVARELHDGVNQKLAMLAVRIGVLTQQASPPAARENLDELRQAAIDLSDDVRSVSHQLHSSELEHLGLVAALQQEAAQLDGHGGVSVTLEGHAPPELPSEAALALYRVGQESLRNAMRHSGASLIRMLIAEADGGVELRVVDNGSGFDPTAAGAGLGLTSMRERVRHLDGRLAVRSAPGDGAEIGAWVPLRAGGR